MNNIFNHYAVETTNAAGQSTGTKVLYKDACQKPLPRSSLSQSKSLRPRWKLTWLNSSQEPGLNLILTTLERLISPNLTLS